MPIGPYDPASVTVALGGVPVVGFADDSFLSIEQSEATYEVVAGVDGYFIRIKKPGSKIWTCTLTLMQSSPHNVVLSALHVLDQNAPNGAGIVPFTMADVSGTTLFSTAEAWISTPPPQTFGSGHNAKAWLVTAIDPDYIIGGN
jgi:hypothetical protein